MWGLTLAVSGTQKEYFQGVMLKTILQSTHRRLGAFASLLFLLIFTASGLLIYYTQYNRLSEANDDRMYSHVEDLLGLMELHRHYESEKLVTALRLSSELYTMYNASFANPSPFYEIMGKVQFTTGLLTTFYQRTPNGFLRVASNQTDKAGSMAEGSFLEYTSSLLNYLDEGEQFLGRTYELDQWFYAAAQPVYENGELLGIIQVCKAENDLGKLGEFFASKSYLENGLPYILSGQGIILAHRNPKAVGMDISRSDIAKEAIDRRRGSIDYIQASREEDGKPLEKVQYFDFYEPYDMLVAATVNKEDLVYKPLASTRNILLAAFFLAFALSSFLVYKLFKRLSAPLHEVAGHISLLEIGEDTNIPQAKGKDETSVIYRAMHGLATRISEAAAFADSIRQGQFDTPFVAKSSNDLLGNALLDMRDSVKTAYEEDKMRAWISEGENKVSGIIRAYNENTVELCYHFILETVKYMEANQGAMYLLEPQPDGNTALNMVACYAYGRRKYFDNRTIAVGDGLAGQAVLEKKYYYLTDVPHEYVEITSGLGGANPNCLMVVPLIYNSEVFGVFEMASFKTYPAYKQEFIKESCNLLASSIAAVKSNERTKMLLAESQSLAQQLRAQEEEMRQNLEELLSTQEAMARREREKNTEPA